MIAFLGVRDPTLRPSCTWLGTSATTTDPSTAAPITRSFTPANANDATAISTACWRHVHKETCQGAFGTISNVSPLFSIFFFVPTLAQPDAILEEGSKKVGSSSICHFAVKRCYWKKVANTMDGQIAGKVIFWVTLVALIVKELPNKSLRRAAMILSLWQKSRISESDPTVILFKKVNCSSPIDNRYQGNGVRSANSVHAANSFPRSPSESAESFSYRTKVLRSRSGHSLVLDQANRPRYKHRSNKMLQCWGTYFLLRTTSTFKHNYAHIEKKNCLNGAQRINIGIFYLNV